VAPPVIVCNEAHRFLVVEQSRQVEIQPLAIIVEPAGRGTAPALTLSALRLAEMGCGPSADPVMLVMPADQEIGDISSFRSAVELGAALAENNLVVTFGVEPKTPETGYGYIRKGAAYEGRPGFGADHRMAPASRNSAYRVSAFVEKPDVESATGYLATGEYMWNSGIFMMRASVWLSELGRLRPEVLMACRAAHSQGHLDGNFYRPGAAEFIACPDDSIDYAVMEKAAAETLQTTAETLRSDLPTASGAAGYVVVPLAAGWSDIGAWSALWEKRAQDSNGNVVQGDVYAHSTENSFLLAHDRLLAAVGLDGVVVVETADAVLVANKADLAPSPTAPAGALIVSAVTGQGLDALRARLLAEAEARMDAGDTPAITRARHRAALRECVACLERAAAASAPELVAEDVRLAARSLGRITGRVEVEDLLDVIFREFCIGK
jgi:mannose-1-phosphate guanylyltransferase/mannose-6-phosphate isomerase